MANSEPLALYVDEEEESYLEWRKHAIEMHLALGIHKLLDLTAYIYQLLLRRHRLSCLPGIKNNLELDKRIRKVRDHPEKTTNSLRRGSKTNLSIILSIHKV